jgi:hypothetical protein
VDIDDYQQYKEVKLKINAIKKISNEFNVGDYGEGVIWIDCKNKVQISKSYSSFNSNGSLKEKTIHAGETPSSFLEKNESNSYLHNLCQNSSALISHPSLVRDSTNINEYYEPNEKTDKKYGLLTGATTADWGDVQHAHPWGVEIDEDTRYCIDIYDNAMFALALNDMIELSENDADKQKWSEVREQILKNTDKYLWDKENRKYIPHVYLTESPFTGFDENKIYYHGGTAVAILAGMLPKEEIVHANNRMLENQKAAHAQTIGLTMYPTYPAGAFESKGMYPYGYQNGGDWTWFGARMIQALIENGMIEEAYTELEPMLTRVIENNSFNEWYTPAGEPMGSGTFRGEAGVL